MNIKISELEVEKKIFISTQRALETWMESKTEKKLADDDWKWIYLLTPN